MVVRIGLHLLPALVTFLCISSDAKAFPYVLNDYTVTVAGYPVGFADWTSTLARDYANPGTHPITHTVVYFGPVGSFEIPFRAAYGVLATGVIVVLVGASAGFVTRRIMRRPTVGD
jgi:hypothetical protein